MVFNGPDAPPQKKTLFWGYLDLHLIHGSLGSMSTRPNGISIGSAVFAELTVVTNRSTDTCSNFSNGVSADANQCPVGSSSSVTWYPILDAENRWWLWRNLSNSSSSSSIRNKVHFAALTSNIRYRPSFSRRWWHKNDQQGRDAETAKKPLKLWRTSITALFFYLKILKIVIN